MAVYENAPFPRGGTWNPNCASTSTDGQEYEGREYWFDDLNYASTASVKPRRSNRQVKCRVVRNACTTAAAGEPTTGNLQPKRIGVFKNDNTATKINGYCAFGITTAPANMLQPVPIDEFLPVAGVVPGDLFYVVVEGPAIVTTGLSMGPSLDIAVGDVVVAKTAVTSGATTSGRLESALYTGNGTSQGLVWTALNNIGRALSACTSGATSATVSVDCLVNVFIKP